jgi:DNA modification methylase
MSPEQRKFAFTADEEGGPVECLGMSFESDAAKREYFTDILRKKLKDPEFRKIEGFPIGGDEDILALSDPPYYTACPNPFLGDFINYYGNPYNPKDNYHREPFAAHVKENKHHPIYTAHTYHTKVPHRAIMRYILYYTEPGALVFDAFAGTGMTGVAAQLCGDRKEVQSLGYRVKADGTILNEQGQPFSKLGTRRAIVNDFAPAATFVAHQYNYASLHPDYGTVASKIIAEIVKAPATFTPTRGVIISTQSASSLMLPPESLDYFFFDPPVGANIAYSELNSTTEAWLRVFTDNKPEAIEDCGQNTDTESYRRLISGCFNTVYRALKPGRWMTVEFSNTQASVWNAIQTTLQEAGFVVANVSSLSKGRGGLMAIIGPTAVKQDLVISAYKPNGGLEKRFAERGETEEGVWEFIRAHLRNLPVVKPRGGLLEPIAERNPRVLYDRTVAFYVRHGISVPISSPEFQAALAEKFPERDGMYFLSDQAAEYDKVRIKMGGLGQLSIFVMDERSATDWLRNYLKDKPSKYNDVQPEFFEQLNQSWKKWEIKPELRSLLNQYFLCYDGKGDVPPQIHAYLSTNFKDLRKLPADDPTLRAKARDRWYVPDHRKIADVEKLRDKRLLEEFWTYLPPGYQAEAAKKGSSDQQQKLPGMEKPQPKTPRGKRLKLIRTEAVRVGFIHCYQNKDYPTIIAVAHHIPDDVVNGDDQLQMIYDTAMTRSDNDF